MSLAAMASVDPRHARAIARAKTAAAGAAKHARMAARAAARAAAPAAGDILAGIDPTSSVVRYVPVTETLDLVTGAIIPAISGSTLIANGSGGASWLPPT